MADVEARTDRRRTWKLYSPHDLYEAIQDKIDRLQQQLQQSGLRVQPLPKSENDHRLHSGGTQAVQGSAKSSPLQVPVGSLDIRSQCSAVLPHAYRLEAIPGVGITTPPDQQVISLHRTTSPLSRARQTMVDDGCLSSNRLDTQPEIGALLP